MSDDVEDMNSRELLIRLDEKLRGTINNMEANDIYRKQEMDRMASMFTASVNAFGEAVAKTAQTYATREELRATIEQLKPSIVQLQRVVFGACGLVLIAVVGSLVSLALRSNGG